MFPFCANKETSKENDGIVKIEYAEPINGFKVSITWIPKEIQYSFAKGPAIIELFNIQDSTISTFTANALAIDLARLPFEYNSDTTAITNTPGNVKLSYAKDLEFRDDGFGTQVEPFFFQDVNFDNKKELIITEYGTGQRGTNNYKIAETSNIEFLNSPFSELDDLSLIDYKNKTITIRGSGGACDGTTEIYKQKTYYENYNGVKYSYSKIELDTYIEMKDCKLYTYKVSQNKVLISVEDAN